MRCKGCLQGTWASLRSGTSARGAWTLPEQTRAVQMMRPHLRGLFYATLHSSKRQALEELNSYWDRASGEAHRPSAAACCGDDAADMLAAVQVSIDSVHACAPEGATCLITLYAAMVNVSPFWRYRAQPPSDGPRRTTALSA
jgi:hypothetical protein